MNALIKKITPLLKSLKGKNLIYNELSDGNLSFKGYFVDGEMAYGEKIERLSKNSFSHYFGAFYKGKLIGKAVYKSASETTIFTISGDINDTKADGKIICSYDDGEVYSGETDLFHNVKKNILIYTEKDTKYPFKHIYELGNDLLNQTLFPIINNAQLVIDKNNLYFGEIKGNKTNGYVLKIDSHDRITFGYAEDKELHDLPNGYDRCKLILSYSDQDNTMSININNVKLEFITFGVRSYKVSLSRNTIDDINYKFLAEYSDNKLLNSYLENETNIETVEGNCELIDFHRYFNLSFLYHELKELMKGNIELIDYFHNALSLKKNSYTKVKDNIFGQSKKDDFDTSLSKTNNGEFVGFHFNGSKVFGLSNKDNKVKLGIYNSNNELSGYGFSLENNELIYGYFLNDKLDTKKPYYIVKDFSLRDNEPKEVLEMSNGKFKDSYTQAIPILNRTILDEKYYNPLLFGNIVYYDENGELVFAGKPQMVGSDFPLMGRLNQRGVISYGYFSDENAPYEEMKLDGLGFVLVPTESLIVSNYKKGKPQGMSFVFDRTGLRYINIGGTKYDGRATTTDKDGILTTYINYSKTSRDRLPDFSIKTPYQSCPSLMCNELTAYKLLEFLKDEYMPDYLSSSVNKERYEIYKDYRKEREIEVEKKAQEIKDKRSKEQELLDNETEGVKRFSIDNITSKLKTILTNCGIDYDKSEGDKISINYKLLKYRKILNIDFIFPNYVYLMDDTTTEKAIENLKVKLLEELRYSLRSCSISYFGIELKINYKNNNQ